MSITRSRQHVSYEAYCLNTHMLNFSLVHRKILWHFCKDKFYISGDTATAELLGGLFLALVRQFDSFTDLLEAPEYSKERIRIDVTFPMPW